MKNRALTLPLIILLLFASVAIVQTVVVAAEDNRIASAPVHEEHFDFYEVMGMFAVDKYIGSFNATTGDYVELVISVTSNDQYAREIRLEIESANHGVIYNATGNSLVQTVNLDYNDIYNITVIKKAPWYTTIRVSGKIDVYHFPPKVTITSIENEGTYGTSDIPLNYTVNEPITEITYSLDGKENIIISEDTILSGLSNGGHNVTVYAVDAEGYVGASETVFFNVEVTFPTTIVVAASGASIALIGTGLLVYFKKRKR